MEKLVAGSTSTGTAAMGKRKLPMMPIEEEEPKKATRQLSPEEIQSHREFLEDDEEPGDIERVLRFLQPADAELVRSATREIDVKKLKQNSARLLEKYDAQGYVEVPVVALPPTTPPGRVSGASIARLRRFMVGSFRPIPERVLRSRFLSESQAERIRNFNRVCLEAESELKAHAAKALQEYDAKGYLECDAQGKIKVSEEPRCSGSTTI